MCATACAWKMPYTIDCPEFANMTEEERAEAYPSPSCFASNTPYLTSLAWCIHSYCPKNTSLYEIEKFWEKDMIYEATSLLYSYPEALAKVDPDHPPAPLSPDETVFNRTISMEDSMWEASFNGVREYGATSKNESTYSYVQTRCLASKKTSTCSNKKPQPRHHTGQCLHAHHPLFPSFLALPSLRQEEVQRLFH